MQSPLGYHIPNETTRVATAAFPKGTCSLSMPTALGMRSTNPQFAELFSSTGRPAEDPARRARILVWHFLDGVSDRQAADAVRGCGNDS